MSTPYTNEPMAIATIEQCICLQCESVIDRADILSRQLRGTGSLSVARKIEAYCRHCDAAYAAIRTLAVGGWTTHGVVIRCIPEDVVRIRKACDEKRGVIQLNRGLDEADLTSGRQQTGQRRKFKGSTLPADKGPRQDLPRCEAPDPFEDPDAQPDPDRLAAEQDLQRRNPTAA